MTNQPLILYLDTQDYIHLFNEPTDRSIHAVLNQILAVRDRGDILIGYSWATMLEFITRPTKDYREDRVRRGELVKYICGRNAFPYFTDLKHGVRFPNKGNWLTKHDGKFVTAKEFRGHMENKYFEIIAEHGGLNRTQRRQLKSPSTLRQVFRQVAPAFGKNREDFGRFPVSDEFIESGIFGRFLSGRCSDAEFEERLNLWLSDPAEFSRIAYDYADKPNLLDEFFGPSIDKFVDALQQVQLANRDFDDLGSTILSRRQDLISIGIDKRTAKSLTPSPQRPALDLSHLVGKIEESIGQGRADHIAHYLRKASQMNYNFKRSDFIDILQMCYAQDCDLFRCDKAMADLFRDYEPFRGKLVSKFSDLPARIDDLLRESGE